ncbi:acyl carrier protein [mine drainage metagenome]|uniref:Acyl carrier protein n=1 Tax=mine drainage metagenome TaxID=410659 RepID=T1BFA8_9ZZZZ
MTLDREQLKLELKKLIVTECQKDLLPEQIPDEAALFGSGSHLALDSLDALQIALAVKQHYGKRLDGGNETRMALSCVNSLADFILSEKTG